MAISYLDALSSRRSRVATAALDVAQSTELAALQTTYSLTRAFFALSSPVFLATSLTFQLVEQQVVFAKHINDMFLDMFVKLPSKTTPVETKAPLVKTANSAAQAAALSKTIDHAAQALDSTADSAAQAAAVSKTIDHAAQAPDSTAESAAQAAALSKTIDRAAQALDSAADSAARARVTAADYAAKAAARKTTSEDQEIELRAERLVINKQHVQHGEARVRKEIVTAVKSFDVPVSREELVIEQYPVMGDVYVDSEPIADETIRIPLTEEKVNITKATVVREQVEIGKRRVEDVEHVSDTVRHEVLRVDDPATEPAAPRLNAEKLVAADNDAAPALVTPDQAFARTSGDAAPALITPHQIFAGTSDDTVPALITSDQVFAKMSDDAVPALITSDQVFAKMSDDAVPALITPDQIFAKTSGDAAAILVTPTQALAGTADDAAPALVTPADDNQELQMRAERLVVNKQRVQHGKARVRKEIVTQVKSIDVPVSHEEVVIDRHAVTGDADVDSTPIGDEMIRIPLTEEIASVTKGTVVREEVEMGKSRVENVEHINDTVRHEELRVDDTTNHSYEPSL